MCFVNLGFENIQLMKGLSPVFVFLRRKVLIKSQA